MCCTVNRDDRKIPHPELFPDEVFLTQFAGAGVGAGNGLLFIAMSSAIFLIPRFVNIGEYSLPLCELR